MQKENFRHQYRAKYGAFANKVKAVFSSPQSAFFGGEHSVIDGGMAIVQHLDRYVWAGVNKLDSGKRPRVKPNVWIPTLPVRENSVPDGYDLNVENLSRKKLEQIIQAACHRFGFPSGLEIHLLTEGFPGSGANTSGAIAATVSACLLWSSGAMSKKEFAAIPTIRPEEIARMKADPTFQGQIRDATVARIKGFSLEQKVCFLNDLAWVIDAFSHGGKASGYGAVAGIVHSRLPFCFFPERRSPHPDLSFSPLEIVREKVLNCRPFDLRRGATQLDNVEEVFNAVVDAVSEISYCVFRLEEAIRKQSEIKKTGALPFTWGVVHSGCTKNTADKINNVEELPRYRRKAFQVARQVLEQAETEKMVSASRTAFGFLGVIEETNETVLRDPMRWEMIGLQSELLRAMCEAMEGQRIVGLARCMRRNQGLLEALGLDWHEGRLIGDTIYRSVGKGSYDETAVKLSGGGGGGCLIFLASAGSGEKIENSLRELQSVLEKVDVVTIQDSEAPQFEFGAGLAVAPQLAARLPRQPIGKRHKDVIPLGKPIQPDFENMVGRSDAMQDVFRRAADVAQIDTTLLITGESGTGKSQLAKAIHQRSHRCDKSLVNVTCGTIPDTLVEGQLFGHEKGVFTGAISRMPGRFEQADGGTILLDEIGEASRAFQVALLGVLGDSTFVRLGGENTKHVNVRCVLATNRDLDEAVRCGVFREDLYYRINRLIVNLPPLRERRSDIPLLARYLVQRWGRPIQGFTAEVLDWLDQYEFPGNMWELYGILENAVFSAGMRTRGEAVIEFEDLPSRVKGKGIQPAKTENVDNERTAIIEAILRAWDQDNLTVLLCLVFAYKTPDACLSRMQIGNLLKSQNVLRFAQKEGLALSPLRNTTEKHTNKQLSERIGRLCEAEWLERIGDSARATRYCKGQQWPD